MNKAARGNSSSANYRLGKYAEQRKYEEMTASNTDTTVFNRKPYQMTAAAGIIRKGRVKASAKKSNA